jgi:glycosyltransferase involved in cell wall biosynthesis
MKILEVAPYFSPQLGGVPEVIYQLSAHLAENGHQVTVLASQYATDKATYPDGGFQQVLLPATFAKFGFYPTPAMVSWLAKHVREYDVIHVHEVRTFQNILVHHFSRRYAIPYVLSAHGTLPLIVQRQTLKRIFDLLFGRRIIESAECIVAVSEYEQKEIVAFGVDPGKIRVIYNGINLEEYENLPPKGKLRLELGIDSESKIILFLGRLHKRKGLRILLEAFARLQSERDDLVLVLAGPDEGERERLEALAAQLGIQRKVLFVGPCYHERKFAALVDADVVVYPSQYEIFGLVPFEALLCGSPVVVSDDSGMGELIRKAKAGFRTPYGDAAALADGIRAALSDPDAVCDMIACGQSFIRAEIDWKIITQKFEALYAGLNN